MAELVLVGLGVTAGACGLAAYQHLHPRHLLPTTVRAAVAGVLARRQQRSIRDTPPNRQAPPLATWHDPLPPSAWPTVWGKTWAPPAEGSQPWSTTRT
jgi:hypothetical protein